MVTNENEIKNAAHATGDEADETSRTEADEMRDCYGRKPYDVHAAATKAVGQVAADFAKHLAEADFDEFKTGMRLIGFPTLFEDEPMGLRGRGISLYSYKMPRLANVALCLRYPFLVPRSRWTGDVIWYDEIDGALYDETRMSVGGRVDAFKTTELDALPIGWMARFGLEVCEDVRTVLGRSAIGDAVELYHIDQIKEKFGTLRWYSSGVPNDVYEDELRVIDLYEDISARTCIQCGGFDRVRGTHGWISYECVHCRAHGSSASSDDAIKERYNSLAEDGTLPRLIARQSDAWKRTHDAEALLSKGFEKVERHWGIPYVLRSLVTANILDDNSYAVGSAQEGAISVIYRYDGKTADGKPVREEIDLLGHARKLGLRAADMVRVVDESRALLDGTSNLPDEEGEAEGGAQEAVE